MTYDLRLGDCLEVMRGMADKSVDAIITDLPYGTTSCSWDEIIPFEPMWAQVKRLCKGAFVTTASQPFTSKLVMSNPKWFKYEWVWHKSKSGSAFTAKHRPVARHENILVFSQNGHTYNPQMEKGKPYHRRASTRQNNNHKLGITVRPEVTNLGTRYPQTVQYVVQDWRRQDQIHPTQKPVALYEYLIRTYTNAGDTVLDFCMGSGTTGVACINTGRNFIGIEKEPNYFEIARRRIEAAAAQEVMELRG